MNYYFLFLKKYSVLNAVFHRKIQFWHLYIYQNAINLLNVVCNILKFRSPLQFLSPMYQTSSVAFQEGMWKWNSHDRKNAKTIHASKIFTNRWPIKNTRLSEVEETGTETAVVGIALASQFWCIDSMSLEPTTFCATELQISQILSLIERNKKNMSDLGKTNYLQSGQDDLKKKQNCLLYNRSPGSFCTFHCV